MIYADSDVKAKLQVRHVRKLHALKTGQLRQASRRSIFEFRFHHSITSISLLKPVHYFLFQIYKCGLVAAERDIVKGDRIFHVFCD